MILNEKATAQLVNALKLTRVMEIERAIVGEGRIRGAKSSFDTAILGHLDLGMGDVTLGVGDVGALLKRLSAFDKPSVECTLKGTEVSSITIKSGRSKLTYRCMAAGRIQAPKSNTDTPACVFSLNPEELKQIAKAINVMDAETVVVQIMKTGEIRLEAVDGNNSDRFDFALETKADFIEAPQALVFSYLASNATKMFSTASSQEEGIELTIGLAGSLTTAINGLDVLLFAQIADDDYQDDED